MIYNNWKQKDCPGIKRNLRESQMNEERHSVQKEGSEGTGPVRQ